MSSTFEKQELQNKLQGFQQGKDYSISSEDGKQIYDIHSADLKKSLWGDWIPVWCKVEIYDKENEHYRGRFEGYKDGYHSVQVWWSGEKFNPEFYSGFEDFDEHWKDFFDWGTLLKYKKQFFNQDLIKDFRTMATKFSPSSINRTNEKKRSGIVHEEQGQVEKYCANHECWNVDKPFFMSDNYCQYCGQFLSLAAADCPIKITNQPKPELEKTQQLELEKQAKNQQVTNLQEENKSLNQRLEAECQAKEEVKKQAQVELNNLQNELKQLREELSQTQEKLIQLQTELKTELEKSSNPDAKKTVEQLAETHQKLKEVDKLTQKSNPNNEELNNVKEQLNNSQQMLAAAAAAHRQLIQEKRFQPQTEIKPVVPSQPKNYVPYLIGGLVIFGASALVLGYSLGQRKKRKQNSIRQ